MSADLNKKSEFEKNEVNDVENINNGTTDASPNNVLTKKMLEEDSEMEKLAILEEKKLKEKIAKEKKAMQEEKCFQQLTLLLSRSSIYAQFMADKLKNRNIFQEIQNSDKIKNVKSNGVKRKKLDTSPKSSKKHCPSSIKSKEQETPQNNIESTIQMPELFCGGTMRTYQLEGFDWLKTLYENGVNGILGDEMGLGKTIQSIAFIAHLIEMGIPGPFFICGPLSTVPNWCAEFQRFAPDIPVILYHGSKEERNDLRKKISQKVSVKNYSSFPVVVTSYSVVLIDRQKIGNIGWKLMIVDEAHRIKNYRCKLIHELKNFNVTHRLLLTGTPLQNNLAELWSLLNFILPDIFNNLQAFETWFDASQLTSTGATQEIMILEQEKKIISTIHQILAPFFLRRTKCDVELELPAKKEVIVHAPLTSLQQSYYTAVLEKTIRELTGIEPEKEEEKLLTDSARPKRERSSFTEAKSSLTYKLPKDVTAEINCNTRNMMMILRKICCHPYLISYPLTSSFRYKIDIELVKSSGKFLVLDVMLPELKKRGHKVIIFSQFVCLLEILEDYCSFRSYNYNILTGDMNLKMREVNIKEFNENKESFLFLVSTRAGGLGINLTVADTVILFDSDWNPQSDLQAQDRCHRIGQTKPVVVYRLVIPSTVDEKIFDRATTKRKLEKAIIHKGRFKSNNFAQSQVLISKDELFKLLEESDVHGFVKTDTNNVLSPEELEKILDRSDLLKK